MQAFNKITSPLIDLPMPNVDTDMIIPKQFLKTTQRTGLGEYLFYELRYDENQQIREDCIFNQANAKHCHIMLSQENFGCGSSREHAVWSLMDFGIRVVIAPSFADIFYSNCFKNGLLAIVLPSHQIEELRKQAEECIDIDLEKQEIKTSSSIMTFDIDPYKRELLLKGLDEIGETLLFESDIQAFEAKQKQIQPWLYQEGKQA